MENFGIDTERDLFDYAEAIRDQSILDRFFSTFVYEEKVRTVGLHSIFVPKTLMQKWTGEMLSSNNHLFFLYDFYKDIRFPQTWTNKLNEQSRTIAQDLAEAWATPQKVPKNLDDLLAAAPFARQTFTPPQDKSIHIPGSKRLENARIIVQEFLGAGYPVALGLAAVVNAKHESGLWESNIGDKGVSVGLFQLHEKYGGKGMTVVQRQNPVLNTRRIIQEYEKAKKDTVQKDPTQGNRLVYKTSLEQAISKNVTLGELTGLFSFHVERPLAREISIQVRSANAYTDFPAVGGMTIQQIQNLFAPITVEEVLPVLTEEEAKAEQERLILEADERLRQKGNASFINEDEMEAFIQLMNVLTEDGWRVYDEQTNVQNLWQKTFAHRCAWGKGDSPEEQLRYAAKAAGNGAEGQFVLSDLVVTNIVGRLQHIVTNIPILGYEYPTQQHLGSIEPIYTIEMAAIDNGAGDGIGTGATLIQTMRSKLQSNARKYRPVPDAHCVLTDTFLTRLLGTSRVRDHEPFNPSVGNKDRVRKRTVISRTSANTVPGHPGLSTIILELEETNPYEGEKLTSTSTSKASMDDAYKRILAALGTAGTNSGLDSTYLPVLIAQLAGQNTARLQGDFPIEYYSSFGMNGNVTLSYLTSGGQIDPNHLIPGSDREVLLLKDPDGSLAVLLNSMKVHYDVTKDSVGSPTGYLAINPNEVAGLTREETSLSQSIGSASLELGNDVVETAKGAFSYGVFGSSGIGKLGSDIKNDVYEAANGVQAGTFSVTEYLNANTEKSTVSFYKVLQYKDYLGKILRSAERMLAEEEKGGYPVATISEQLYSVPVLTHMWQCFQGFFNGFVNLGTNRGFRTWDPTSLERNSNYFTKGDPISPQTAADINAGGRALSWAASFNVLGEVLDLPIEVAGGYWSAWINGDITMAEFHKSKIDEIRRLFVNSYLTTYPLAVIATETLTSIASPFKYVIGDWENAGNRSLDATFYLQEAFLGYLDSCNLLFSDITGSPIVQSPGTTFMQDGNLVRQDNIVIVESKVPDLLISALQKLAALGSSESAATLLAKWEDQAKNGVQIGPEIGAPCQYPTDRSKEDSKIRYIKQLLAALAQEIMQDTGLLEALGLQDLANFELTNSFVGSEGYPDMKLPAHPYFDTPYQVGPDFYMWNMYEDGDATAEQFQKDVAVEARQVMQNSYQSLKEFQVGKSWHPSNNPVVSEPDQDSMSPVALKFSPEGSDNNANEKYGAMGSPFAMSKEAKIAEENFAKSWDNSFKSYNESTGNEILSASGYSNTKPPKGKGADSFFGDTSYNIRVGTTDGSVHYPTRISMNQYKELWGNVDKLESMFGNKAGYLGEELTNGNTDGLPENLKDTKVEVPDEYVHGFDPESLIKLAEDSSKDMLSQKMTMKRAYPTFKLFFVEEDELENRFLNYDDFHSYNAVRDFSVVLDKKMAADTAVITLQNVSGTLDGTARNTVTDLDYFSRTRTKAMLKDNPDAGVLAGDSTTEGTDADQPFGAIVLRPGLNVQLRSGYSNDPAALEVLISGRIVDISWNQTGDLVEITVQSFGAELEQILKGTGINNDTGRTFYSSHQLLSTMMLEPELTHFGRWEIGQTFQIGESKDARLDFVDYSREGNMGRYRIVSGVTRWIVNHPCTMFALAATVTALQFLPYGKASSGIGRGLLKAVGYQEAKIVGESAVKRAIVGGLKSVDQNLAGTAKVIAQREAVARAVAGTFTSSLDDLGKVSAAALKNVAKAGYVDDIVRAVTKVDDFTDDAIEGLLATTNKLDRAVASRTFMGRFLGVSTFAPTEAGWWTSSGKAVLWRGAKTWIAQNTLVGVPAAIAALSLDLIRNQLIEPSLSSAKLMINKIFTRAKVSMMLSPQDDNLYPPSPKDYMLLEKPGFLNDLAKVAVRSGSRLFTGSDDLGNLTFALWNPNLIFEKRVEPQQCQYNIISSTIWDIFYEMTLRHPGWAFGPRPYGRDFRYTMFFGVPSQRYWSKPATNRFVYRMNTLKTFLSNKIVEEGEYRVLYGNMMPDGRTIEEWKGPREGYIGDWNPTETATTPESLAASTNLEMTMTAKATEEYLRGLELRFVPFRRYHMLSSSRDLVWNGIIASESSVVNAIDVAFFDYGTMNENSIPQGTELIKAHSTMAEGMIRTSSILYPNCKGYTMAMRYGMGELIHSMKEMYRGEIIVLGNPRIRPWDVGILVDTYNDMVGPIEVEQVIHNFSHETGFITEIKPGAIVIGNEISSWPVIEAMKLWAMAVTDAESQIQGLAGSQGGIKTVADMISTWGGEDVDSYLEKKYKDERHFPTGADLARDGLGGDHTVFPTSDPTVNLGTVISELSDSVAELTDTALTSTIGALGNAALVEGVGLVLTSKPMFGVFAPAVGVLTLAKYGNSFGMAVKDAAQFPSLAWLIGGTVLFARNLREDAVIVVPLMKGGQPIVAGLSYQDPSMLWSNFKGTLNSFINDAAYGLRDTLDEYQRYGSALWRTVTKPEFGTDEDQYTSEL